MINAQTAHLHTRPAWNGWPTEIGQTALEVIAMTRWDWVSRRRASPAIEVAGGHPVQFTHPLIQLAADATRSRSGRARRALARARRGRGGRFGV